MDKGAIDKVTGAPFEEADEANEALLDGGEQVEPDETTGASPGTAQACSDLGLNSLESNLAKFGIKPPGVA